MQELAQERSPPAMKAGGKTRLEATAYKAAPPLSATEVVRLMVSIDTETITGLHDQALLGVMMHCLVRAGAVPALRGLRL